MAGFISDFDVEDIMGGLLKMINTDEVAIKMVDAGLDVMADAIAKGASKHKVTGHMANSVYKTKIKANKQGDVVGRTGFKGTEGVVISKKSGKKFDRTNWIKAFRIEYGTSKQQAKPFVRPAIANCRGSIASAMQKVFEEEVGNK